ncbi:MAG: heat-inducible transcriptional repressor HrcA [Spirochaetia bacterium]|nr:heat-inducible transcriptional repressor HrcA [Spirochaetia bacterium]
MTERQVEIIHAIVNEFVNTGEPVSSQILVSKFRLEVSSATVRKEMSLLEQMGYLNSPHTSAGRIPTDSAFQFYVNSLSDFYQITISQKTQLDEFYNKAAMQLDQLLRTTSHLLAVTSNYAGYVLSPMALSSIINHVELISIAENMVLLVMVSGSESVYQKKITVPKKVTQEDLYKISRYLNQRIKGYEIADLQKKELDFLMENASELDDLSDIAALIAQSLIYNPPEQELYLEGENTVFQKIIESTPSKEKADYLIAKLGDKNFVCEMVNRVKNNSGVCGKVGIEIDGDYLEGVSVLAKGYSAGGRDVGTLGVIGMNRMPYEKLIPTIDYGSKLLSKFFNEKLELNAGHEERQINKNALPGI